MKWLLRAAPCMPGLTSRIINNLTTAKMVPHGAGR